MNSGDGNRHMGWGSDVVAETLRQLGIPFIALVPGASFRGLHDSLVNYLGNQMPEMVVCLHEEHAVAIAEGYARVTETPMAVALHSNVGLMHAAMPIFNAWCDRTPVLLIGATGPMDADARRPWIDWIHTSQDQGAIVRPYVKWDGQPTSPKAAVEAIFRAYQIADSRPKGPAYVCLDVGMQEAELNEDVAVPDVRRYRAGSPAAAAAADVDAVVNAVKNANSPVVLLGRLSRDTEDWDARVRFAERLGAPVLTTLHRPPAFPTAHPLHILPPSTERPSAEETDLIRQADLILSFDWVDLAGYLRNCLDASQTQTPTQATVIQCALDSYIHNGWSMDHQALPALDITILADPDTLVRQLDDRLSSEGFDGEAPVFGTKGGGAHTHWTDAEPIADTDAAETALPIETFARTVADFCDGRDVSLARLPIGWPGTACRFSHPLDYLGKDGGGAVGTGPGHTIGTALALKDSGRIVMGIIGDGDFLMGVNALWTASNQNIPVILIVANNGGYYNDVRHQDRIAVERGRPRENKWIGQALSDPRPDIVGLARAQGFEGEGPIETLSDLADALVRAEGVFRNGGRYILDVSVLGY
jgi:benzoylformate decarboxylase